ncbi:MAG: hypothetical protein Q9179_003810 [Wetmoreana sp. 5 TL-2023]
MRSSVMNFEASKKGAAPVWWAQAGLVNRRFHAEDGAFYNWETSTDANTVDGRYPSGSIVAVWGTFDRDKTSHEVSSCIGPRIPSCKDVARALGVGFRGNLPQAAPQGNIPQTTQQPVSEDSGDEIDKDWTEEDNKLMALCNTGGHRKRAAMHGKGLLQRDTSTCNPFPFPSVVSASTVTDTFPNSDYDLSTGVVATNVELSGLVTIGSITTSPTTTGPTATSMITAAPGANPTCSIRNQDPDRGINSGFCICDQTVTLPLLSISTVVEEDESCHYTTMPTTPQITIKPTVGPAMTDTKHCQVCTPVVKWEEQSCTSLPGCIVQTGAVTVQAGSSPVHVGTLTGSELYNSVSSALEKLCPSATQTDSLTTCETDTVRIKNIPYMDGEKAYDDEPATGKNCYDQQSFSGIEKRSDEGFFRLLSGLFARSDYEPTLATNHATWCNTVGFAGVNYYNPYWRDQPSPGATDWIDARWAFHKPPEGEFACDLLNLAVDALVLVEPEFAVGEVELREAIDVVCKEETG